jgi:hypothetical protein
VILTLHIICVEFCLSPKLDQSYWMELLERGSAWFPLFHLIYLWEPHFLFLVLGLRFVLLFTLLFTKLSNGPCSNHLKQSCRLQKDLKRPTQQSRSWLLLVLLALKLWNKHHNSFCLCVQRRYKIVSDIVLLTCFATYKLFSLLW